MTNNTLKLLFIKFYFFFTRHFLALEIYLIDIETRKIMSTSYYALPKLDEKEKQGIITLIQQDRIVEAKFAFPDEVHLGRAIAKAPQFIFNHNDWKYFNKSLSSLESFIQNAYIMDEYGTEFTVPAFWDRVYLYKDGPVYGDEIHFDV